MQVGQIPLPFFMVIAACVTFGFTFVAGEFVLPMLRKKGVVDKAGHRSSHTGTVVRGVGIAIAIAYIVGSLLVFFSVHGVFNKTTALLLFVSLLGVVTGLFEDWFGLSVPVRSVVLLILASIVAGVLVMETGFQPIDILFIVYSVLFVSGYINVANFMDGLNGQSSFHGIVAGLGFAATGWFTNVTWVFAIGLVLAAAFAGFLPMNLRGRAFMGDSGSYLLGTVVAVISMAMFKQGFPFLATIGPMVIYFGDVAVTMVSRKRRGLKVTEPHKEFTFHRIREKGYSHLQVSLMVTGASAATTVLGIASMWFLDIVSQIVFFVAGFCVLVGYLLLPKILPVVGDPVHSESKSDDSKLLVG